MKQFVYLLCLIVCFNFSNGQNQEDAECRREHGLCTKHVYENIRLAALRSSNCRHFCQCAHASTEVDGSVTYMWVRQECPPTTLFDDSLPAPVCNHERNVQCHGDDDEDCQSEHGACTQFIYENVRLVAQTSSGCKKFCQCAHASTEQDGSVTYQWIEHTCPDGTLFDNSLPARVCNHAENVQCEQYVQPGEDTTPQTVVHGTTSAGVSDNDECLVEYGLCTRDQYENVRLVALRSSGCKHFCQCAYASTQVDGSVTYKWVKKTCPDGTLFDESLPAPVCNHAYNVKCQVPGIDECLAEYGSCSRDQYENVRLVALRSSGCKNFCQCAYASTQLDGSVTYTWVKKTCPDGTLFDESLPTPVCNHDFNVKCQGDHVQGETDTTPSNLEQRTTSERVADSDECLAEYGLCSRDQYENVRLVALRSSGCKNFCQCAYASTQPDGSVTYKWVKKTCPDGTLFDESLPAPVCNHAYKVKCQDTANSEDCEEEHGACTWFIYKNVRLVPKRTSGCEKFCQCTFASTELDGSVTFKWVEHSCSAGTLFDQELRVCDFADKVICEGGNFQKGEDTTPTTLVHRTTSATVPDNDECLAEYGFCSRDQYENVRLVALHSSGCKNFCQCAHASTQLDGSVTYKWVKKTCPDGTLFDESLPAPVCNHAYKVKCQDIANSEDCEEEHGACTWFIYKNVRLVPKRTSGCEKFCQCTFASTELDGSVTFKWVEHNCPAGTLFDQEIRVCNFADKVDCEAQRAIIPLETTASTEEPFPAVNKCESELGTCTQEEYNVTLLAALKSSGCQKFCMCAHASSHTDGSVTYHWVEEICPQGTLFDEEVGVCNYEEFVQC